MNESFLHYVWQFQYFNKVDLKTCEGEPLQIFKTGTLNTNAGPDFLNAKLKIGDLEWNGHVEMHLKTSQWNEHRHVEDEAYNNVVLHIVYDHDATITRRDGTTIPTLELKQRIDQQLLQHYFDLVAQEVPVPCANSLHKVEKVTKLAMLDRVAIERLQTKAKAVLELLSKNGFDWEETCYQLLARNFGFKVNADAFLSLASTLPYKVLLKHADQPQLVEAMLFGTAGFLEGGMQDEYFQSLQREYAVLGAKYQLKDKRLQPAVWKFLRLRPANFPTLRLAQFAALLVRVKNIFSRVIECEDARELYQIFGLAPSEYWQSHYRFGRRAKGEVYGLGRASIENIIINTVAPLFAAYAINKDDERYLDRAQLLLTQVSAEKNNVTDMWRTLQWEANSEFDSQALLHLHHYYCMRRECLNCSIGAALLKPMES